LEVRAVVALSLTVPEWRRDFGAGRANSVKARARDSGDLWSALTEFAPALRCHYPGQAGVLEADSNTRAVLLLPTSCCSVSVCSVLIWSACAVCFETS